jgi:ElaB/YqjD/DUF883 family membrane-anchored ribosome-binding protein
VTEEQRSPEEIRADIEAAREQLGDTAAAVAQKTDVKQQAKAKVSGVKEKTSAKREEVAEKAPDSAGAAVEQAQRFARENPAALAIGGAFVAGFALGKLRSR